MGAGRSGRSASPRCSNVRTALGGAGGGGAGAGGGPCLASRSRRSCASKAVPDALRSAPAGARALVEVALARVWPPASRGPRTRRGARARPLSARLAARAAIYNSSTASSGSSRLRGWASRPLPLPGRSRRGGWRSKGVWPAGACQLFQPFDNLQNQRERRRRGLSIPISITRPRGHREIAQVASSRAKLIELAAERH